MATKKTTATTATTATKSQVKAALALIRETFGSVDDPSVKAALLQSMGIDPVTSAHPTITQLCSMERSSAGVKMVAVARLGADGEPQRKARNGERHDHKWVMPSLVRDILRIHAEHPDQLDSVLRECESE